MKQLLKRLLITLAVVIVAFFALFTSSYFLLWKPSLQGKCGGRMFGSPEPARPRLARFRGEVVGKKLSIVQYRWLRRRFKAVGTTLSLARELPSTEYQGTIVRHNDRVADVVVDKSGRVDFGDLMPGEYNLLVTYPRGTAGGFQFVIHPASPSTGGVIDASAA